MEAEGSGIKEAFNYSVWWDTHRRSWCLGTDQGGEPFQSFFPSLRVPPDLVLQFLLQHFLHCPLGALRPPVTLSRDSSLFIIQYSDLGLHLCLVIFLCSERKSSSCKGSWELCCYGTVSKMYLLKYCLCNCIFI